MKLRDYQETAADFLYEHDRAMILAPVGAGKTAITLTAMWEMLRDEHVKRFLVLAPKRVCTDVWPVEQPKWAPMASLAVAVGTPKQRLAALKSNARIVVTNYDNIQWLADQKVEFDGVVFDELTKLKNPSGARFKALNKVLDCPVRWGLTGSFTSNGLEDVFGQCKIVDQSLLGRAKGAFMQQYFVLINKDFGEWEPRKGALELVMQRIKPATFVLEPGEYKDKLPPLHTVEVACKMDMTGYNKMKKEFMEIFHLWICSQ
jgi:superfamily II DNA or RNA helicase